VPLGEIGQMPLGGSEQLRIFYVADGLRTVVRQVRQEP
jgi:hypothetical protein